MGMTVAGLTAQPTGDPLPQTEQLSAILGPNLPHADDLGRYLRHERTALEAGQSSHA
jgi:hypothetical protein